MDLSHKYKFAGNALAIAGLSSVALATIAIWVSKHFGLETSVASILSWVNFSVMMVLITLAMGCFWMSDRINKRAGLKTMAEEAGEKKSKWLPWT